jgi:hypothetical protein
VSEAVSATNGGRRVSGIAYLLSTLGSRLRRVRIQRKIERLSDELSHG